MRMKPWIALLLTAAMVLSLTACGAIIPRNQPDSSNSPASSEPPITTAAPVPLDILKTAWEKWDMDTGDMDIQAKLSQSSQGVTVDIGLGGNVKVMSEQGSNQCLADLVITAMGENISVSLYMDDSYTYVNMLGMKIKSALEDSDDQDGLLDKLDGMTLSELGEMDKYLLDSSAEEKDGRQLLSFTISGSGLTEEMGDLLAGGLEEFGVSLPSDILDSDSMHTEISDILLKTEINPEGLLDKITLDTAVVMTGNTSSSLNLESQIEVVIKTALDIEMKFNNPGQTVVITPPDDLDTYVDASENPEPGSLSMEAVQAVLSSLYTDDGSPVANYLEVYQQLCDEYGQDVVDTVLEIYVEPYLSQS